MYNMLKRKALRLPPTSSMDFAVIFQKPGEILLDRKFYGNADFCSIAPFSTNEVFTL